MGKWLVKDRAKKNVNNGAAQQKCAYLPATVLFFFLGQIYCIVISEWQFCAFFYFPFIHERMRSIFYSESWIAVYLS